VAKQGNNLFIVDQKEARYLDCSNLTLPFGPQFVADVVNRTQVAPHQAQCLLAAELSIEAQRNAKSVTIHLPAATGTAVVIAALPPAWCTDPFGTALISGHSGRRHDGYRLSFNSHPGGHPGVSPARTGTGNRRSFDFRAAVRRAVAASCFRARI
jgi:hypothetical protein